MQKTLFRTLCALMSVLLLLSAASCGKKGERLLESSKAETTAVMRIDGRDVPLEIYRYLALNYKRDYEAGSSSDIWLGESGAALLEELQENVTASLAYLYATVSLAEEYGIRTDDPFVTDTVDRRMKAVYEEYGNDYEAYVEYLRTYNMNDSVYRFLVRNDVLAEELAAEMQKRGEIPADDASLRKILAGDEVVRVKQILVTADSMTEEEAIAKTRSDTAYPGESEHQSGLAVDVLDYDHTLSNFAGTYEAEWLAENCWKFGFILRYPQDKEEITTYVYEPWHLRYVGRYHAKRIYDMGMCLEEYVEYLANNP